MSRRAWRGFLAGVLLLGASLAARAYVDCIDVTIVYSNGYTTQCKDCNIYSNTDGSWQGEITNCPGTRGGSV
ncbi:MAG TPA: hypothetical protein VFR03_02465 [Thermoanaerobaculia bacterium]|nr:hypothetical protein [Thermoanaerobaculia bacterium]